MGFLFRAMVIALTAGRVFAEAAYLPENHSVNGGLTIIPIDIKQQPQVYYHIKKFPCCLAPMPISGCSSSASRWIRTRRSTISP